MSSNNIKNFTPIMDNVASDLGLIPAAVYGVVWRFCQMNDGVCQASLQTMGDKLGANKATVMRHIKALCKAGWITDLDKGARNYNHRYIANEYKTLQSATNEDIENNQFVAECNAVVAECNKFVAESNLKKLETLEETINGNGKTATAKRGEKRKRKPSEYNLAIGELNREFSKLTGIPLPTTKTDKKFWNGYSGKLYTVANKDLEIAKKLIEYTVKKMRGDELTISSPKSLLNVATDVMATRAAQLKRKQATTTSTGGVWI